MQNKGAIRLFAIIFALVCIYSLSFSFFTRKVQKDAIEYSQSNEAVEQAKALAGGDVLLENYLADSIRDAREQFYLDSMDNVVVYNLLVRKYTFRECKEREINLGLDLKGGMNVTMEVSVIDIIRNMASDRYSKDPESVLNKAIEGAKEAQKDAQTDFVTLFHEEFKTVAPDVSLAAVFSTKELQGRVSTTSTDEEVIKVIREESSSAIDRTFEILRKRIDRFGVAQPNIQLVPATGRILIELPGVKDPARVRKLLQGTAKLEFWECHNNQEIYPFLEKANEKARLIFSAMDTVAEEEVLEGGLVAGMDSNVVETPELAVQDTMPAADTLGGGLTELLKTDDTTTAEEAGALGQESFAEYAKQNPLFAYMRPSVFQNENGEYFLSDGAVVGTSKIRDTAKVNAIFRLPAIKSILPANLKLLWSVKPITDKDGSFTNPDGEEYGIQLFAIETPRDGIAKLGGDKVVDAYQDVDPNGKVEVVMQMNQQGSKIWKNMTGQNVGEPIAIVLDDYVYSAPNVMGEIPNGRSSISGQFDLKEAKDLASMLKVGKMPAPAHIVEEAVVGPSLGHEAVNSGLLSMIVAFIMVLIYMNLYYNRAGLVANVALITNMFFLFGVLASLQAVLTLPGIAGIVLTLGMAVDANVIIYERVKEEIRLGKGVRLAINDGYKNAYSAIIDGNVTTLLTGIVLFIFGSGPVQGFATTLIIGILTSLFSAIFISRLVFSRMLNKNRKVNFGNKKTINWFTKVNVNFVGLRRRYFIVSGIVIIIGIGSLFVRGLSFGVDFSGGRNYVVRFDQTVSTEEIAQALAVPFESAPEVKTFGPTNQVKITTKYMIEADSIEADSIVESKLFEGIKGFFKDPINYEQFASDADDKLVGKLSSQKVGPTIADDIKKAAVWAILFAMVIIFVYIALRFRKWQFGLGGIAALLHDTLIAVSIYSLFYGILPFNLEVDQSFIAAILTIIGYSINDSVIIFDRIREYTRERPKTGLKENINDALNSTLGRSFNTSGTTFVVLLTIFIFGGEVIRGFTFTLMIGVLVGTYSSLFTASPIAYELTKGMEKRKLEKKSKKK